MRDKKGTFIKGHKINVGIYNGMYGKKAWNAGLTKHTDERIAKYSKKLIGRKGHTPWNKGLKNIHLSPQTEFKKGQNIGKNHPNWKGGLPKCIVCNKQLKKYGAKHCYSHAKEGKLHPRYVNGNSKKPYSLEFSNYLKALIRKRDNHTCQKCGIKEKHYYRKLDIHHINYNKQDCNEKNLITLCQSCNNKANNNRNYWSTYFISIIRKKYD